MPRNADLIKRLLIKLIWYYAPIQCFSIEEYYRNNERWDQVLSFLRWQIRGQGSICSRTFYLMSKGEKTYETQPREITSSQTS